MSQHYTPIDQRACLTYCTVLKTLGVMCTVQCKNRSHVMFLTEWMYGLDE